MKKDAEFCRLDCFDCFLRPLYRCILSLKLVLNTLRSMKYTTSTSTSTSVRRHISHIKNTPEGEIAKKNLGQAEIHE